MTLHGRAVPQWAFLLFAWWLGVVPASATHNRGSFGGISLLDPEERRSADLFRLIKPANYALVERKFLLVFGGTFSTLTAPLVVHTVGPITLLQYVHIPRGTLGRPEPRHFPNAEEWSLCRRAYSDVDLSRFDALDLYVSGALLRLMHTRSRKMLAAGEFDHAHRCNRNRRPVRCDHLRSVSKLDGSSLHSRSSAVLD